MKVFLVWHDLRVDHTVAALTVRREKYVCIYTVYINIHAWNLNDLYFGPPTNNPTYGFPSKQSGIYIKQLQTEKGHLLRLEGLVIKMLLVVAT